jgi:hypothetical protein
MRRNFLHRQLTGRSVAAENIHVVVDVADRANRRVIPASAFAAFGANSFTPFFMRKLLHNGNDALKGCTVASPPLLLFELARLLVGVDHIAVRCAKIIPNPTTTPLGVNETSGGNDCELDGAESRCGIHRAYSLTPAG